MIVLIATLQGCQRVTVEDAKKTANAESGLIAKNLTEFHKQQEESKKDKTSDKEKETIESDNPFDKSFDEESVKKITVAEIGDTVNLTDMECQVSEVLLAKNIYELNSITDEESAASVIEDIIEEYGSDSRLARINGEVYLYDNGDVGESSISQFMFVKIKMHYMGNLPKEICMRPIIYGSNGDSGYQYKYKIEVETMDKKQQEYPNEMYYVFEPGEEEEFIIAFTVRGDITGCSLYLDTRFARSGNYSSDPMEIPDGTQFIKLSSEE
jgi:hypothetical protein